MAYGKKVGKQKRWQKVKTISNERQDKIMSRLMSVVVFGKPKGACCSCLVAEQEAKQIARKQVMAKGKKSNKICPAGIAWARRTF